MPDCPNPGKENQLSTLHGVGELQWQACAGSTRFFVKARQSGAALGFAADEVVTDFPPAIGTEVPWFDFLLVDLDNDGDPELHARAPGEAAVPEVCQWYQGQTKAAGCDPLLELSSSARSAPGGTLLLVQAPGDWRKNTDLSAAFLIDQGHARLLKATHGNLDFSRGRPACFERHQISTWSTPRRSSASAAERHKRTCASSRRA
jgi:hypothetical protein